MSDRPLDECTDAEVCRELERMSSRLLQMVQHLGRYPDLAESRHTELRGLIRASNLVEEMTYLLTEDR